MNHNFQVASTRWCPTAEQIMILEEIYRGGMRTPKAYQIEQITSQLSLYGKIECKNVFYWFQNHKARERQKLRRMFNIPRYSQNPSVPPWVSAQGLLTQFHPQEIVLKEASLLSKLEKIHKEERENSSVENGSDTTTLMETDDVDSVDRYRSLKTLELFPTQSTGNLKNEGMQ